MLINLAGVLGDAGKFREANRTFGHASALMADLGYDDTQKAVKLFNDWALCLTYDGRRAGSGKNLSPCHRDQPHRSNRKHRSRNASLQLRMSLA